MSYVVFFIRLREFIYKNLPAISYAHLKRIEAHEYGRQFEASWSYKSTFSLQDLGPSL